jgi:poly(3-hydroxybutyrate) depolymerase
MRIMMFIFLLLFVNLSFAKDSDLMLKKSFKASTGTTLNYLLFVPKNYNAAQKYPLVVTLHAAGSDYIYQVDNNDQAHPWIEDSVQARWPSFIMAPNCPSGSWGGMFGAGTSLSPECKAVIEAVEDLKKQYSLDTNRFIIGGFSIGGAGTYHMIQFMPDYFAAACPVAAGGDSSKIDLIAKTPIWHHQGTNDNNGAALTRMATALENHKYPVLRITSDMVVNSPAGWNNEIQKGTKPENIIYKNAKPSYDSVCKAVDAGANYIYQMITGANHEDSRLNANHNPLLAKWAFSKVKTGGTITKVLVPITSNPAENTLTQYIPVLTFGKTANLATGRAFTLQGRIESAQDARKSSGTRILIVRKNVTK